jgi:hypothetical protein
MKRRSFFVALAALFVAPCVRLYVEEERFDPVAQVHYYAIRDRHPVHPRDGGWSCTMMESTDVKYPGKWDELKAHTRQGFFGWV